MGKYGKKASSGKEGSVKYIEANAHTHTQTNNIERRMKWNIGLKEGAIKYRIYFEMIKVDLHFKIYKYILYIHCVYWI